MMSESRGLSRRKVLTTSAMALAGAAIPNTARAAIAHAAAQAAHAAHAGRTTEPQSVPPEGRVLASLNGTWDFMPTTGSPTTPPTTGTWDSIPVPAEWNMTAGDFATTWNAYDLFETPSDWDSVDVAWYRRTVDIPATRPGDRIVLVFGAVNFAATVFFNGTQVATHTGGLLPFEADVTEYVNATGTNTVHVLVTSGTQAAQQSDGWHYPNGSWWGQTCWGIWQDVWLLARPATYIQDAYIVTSLNSKNITVTTTVANVGTAARTVRVTHQVTGTAIAGQTEVTVAAGGTATVTFTKPWASPRLWNQQDPHLYQLEITTDGGDTYTTRFGFREVAVSDTDILLNGEPVLLRGDAYHYMGSMVNSRAYATTWFTMVKELGVNYLRMHAMPYPPVFYDVADEMGLLIVAESAIYGSSNNYALGAADFWANCDTHLTARVLRDRNHPCVFAWSAENEVLAAAGQSWAAQVATLKPVVTALDDTRPVYFEGDGDPEGVADMESTHYPWELYAGNTALPESMYAVAPGGSAAGFWDHKKPMIVGEFSSMDHPTPSLDSAVGGPATFTGLDGLYAAHALILRAQVEGFRYAGTTGLSPWNTVWYGTKHLPFDPARESLPPKDPDGPRLRRIGRWAATLNPGFEPDLPAWQSTPVHDAVRLTFPATAALATDYRTHFWAGEPLTRTYAVYNAVGVKETVTVTVELRLASGQSTTISRHVAAAPDGPTDVTFTINVPAVRAITPGTLTVRVGDYEYAAPLSVYPRSVAKRTTSARLSALVYQVGAPASASTAAALTALGVSTTTITDLSTLPVSGGLLVIGEGATLTPTAAETAAVLAFVQGGGRVLSLAQSTPAAILPWKVLGDGMAQTIAHVGAAHHPVLTGIGADDLRWWNTASELVVSQGLVKPRYGSLTSIADMGPGLASSALAEAPYGTGTYLLCQFPVIAAAGDEPIAAILLRNLVDYLATRPATAPRTLGVASASGSDLTATLTDAAVAYTSVSTVSGSTLSGLDVLLLDVSDSAAVTAVTAGATDLNAWVNAGGTLWVNGLTSASLDSLSGVLPSGTTLASLDSSHQLGALTTENSALLDGLNNADLDWSGSASPLVTETVSVSGGTSAADSRGVDWTMLIDGVEQTMYQNVLESELGFTPASVFLAAVTGSGRVVLDMLNWPSSLPLPSQTALAAGIAAGLGIGFVESSGSGLLSTTGWTGFASPNNGAAPDAYDGNLTTRWSSNAPDAPGMYFGLDLGATHTLTKIIWDNSPAPTDMPISLDIQTSPDGTTYTTVLSLTAAEVTSMTESGVLTIPLDGVTTQYLKLLQTGTVAAGQHDYYLSLYELYLFGS
jgi:beta-galactosidase